MASSEERMKILKMIEEGKLSAEEGTKLNISIELLQQEALPVWTAATVLTRRAA